MTVLVAQGKQGPVRIKAPFSARHGAHRHSVVGHLRPLPGSFAKPPTAKPGFEEAKSPPIIATFLIAAQKKNPKQAQTSHPTSRPQALRALDVAGLRSTELQLFVCRTGVEMSD